MTGDHGAAPMSSGGLSDVILRADVEGSIKRVRKSPPPMRLVEAVEGEYDG